MYEGRADPKGLLRDTGRLPDDPYLHTTSQLSETQKVLVVCAEGHTCRVKELTEIPNTRWLHKRRGRDECFRALGATPDKKIVVCEVLEDARLVPRQFIPTPWIRDANYIVPLGITAVAIVGGLEELRAKIESEEGILCKKRQLNEVVVMLNSLTHHNNYFQGWFLSSDEYPKSPQIERVDVSVNGDSDEYELILRLQDVSKRNPYTIPLKNIHRAVFTTDRLQLFEIGAPEERKPLLSLVC